MDAEEDMGQENGCKKPGLRPGTQVGAKSLEDDRQKGHAICLDDRTLNLENEEPNSQHAKSKLHGFIPPVKMGPLPWAAKQLQ